MNENEDEQIYTEQDALQAIQDIAKTGLSNEEILNEIESDLSNIDQNVQNLNDYIIIQEPENEQKTEEIIEKEEEKEPEKQTKSGEVTRTEEVTLSDIHEEIVQVNENITMTNYILTGNILFMGVIAGIVLFKIMWDRFSKK